MLPKKEEREWIRVAERMPLAEVKALDAIAHMNVPIDPQDPLDNMMVWLCDIISRIMTIRNTDKTQYSPEVEADIELALYHLIDKDAERDFPTQMAEYGACREATKDVLIGHFKETFTGKKPYQPIEQMPVITWAWEKGSVLTRISAFTELFYLIKNASEVRH